MDEINGAQLNPEQLISDTIAHVYEAALDRRIWYAVLENIACLTASKSAILLYRDELNQHAFVLSSYGFDDKWLRQYHNIYAFDDPVLQLISSASEGEMIALSCENRDDPVCESETYRAFYQPQGVYHLAGICLIKNENGATLLGFQRTKSAPEYQPEVLEQLKVLLPHLQRALQYYQVLSDSFVKNDALASSIDAMQMGMVFFNQQGQVSYCNKSASAIIHQHPAIVMQNRDIIATSDICNKKLRDAITAASEANLDGCFIKSVAIGLRSSTIYAPLPVLITPIHQLNVSPQLSEDSIAVVMILTDPDQVLLTSTEFLRTIYGLTKSEAFVAIGLANAMSVKDIADEKGVQPTTIRSQVQSIYSKMGVKTQAQLVKMLLYSPLATIK